MYRLRPNPKRSLTVSLALAVGATLALLWLLGGARSPVAQAANLSFPGCAPTLQGCIDGAANGDTIVIAPGIYPESLTLNKAVSLTASVLGDCQPQVGCWIPPICPRIHTCTC